MNPLDRTIAWFAPRYGLQRERARAQIGMLRQSYDGAKTGRRTSGWTAGGTSANSEIAGARSKLIARSRDLIRNNPHILNAKRTVRLYSVGTGIELQLDDPAWQRLWDDWIGAADVGGTLDFYGQQALAAATIFESGSVLLRARGRRPEDGLRVPLQIEMLEPDFLDATRDASRDGGGYIQEGIEFDRLGRRIGYWIHPVHPGEIGSAFWARSTNNESRFVPADRVSHAFTCDRPGQVTGVPWPHSVIIKSRDLSDYEDAELFRKKIEACNVGAVTQAGGVMGNPLGGIPGDATTGSGPGETGGSPRPEQFEPGMFFYFGPGEDVTFNDPKGNTAYESYTKTAQKAIGAGMGVPYDKLTGDLSEANFSSLKAGSNQFEALMDSFRWLTLIPRVCDPVLQWFFESAELSRSAPGPRPEYEWQPPPYPEVDPQKEAMARLIDTRSGVKTMPEIIRSRGGDPRRQVEQIKEWNDQLDAAGIVLDSDPRQVTRAGVGHTVAPNSEGDDE